MHLSVNFRGHDSMQNITFLTANLEMKLNKKDNNKVIRDRNSLWGRSKSHIIPLSEYNLYVRMTSAISWDKWYVFNYSCCISTKGINFGQLTGHLMDFN